MIKTLLFVLCLVTNGRHIVDGIRNTHTEDLELDKQLKLVNKPPVKSIHRKPSVQNSMRAKSIVGLHKVECPSGTVPIRRTMKNDLIKSKLLFNNHIMTQELQPGHHDKNTKNWWLSVQNQHIGYFPEKLFSGMSSANIVGWGGETITPKGIPSPPMGSGYFPDGDLIHACYFRHVTFQNASWQNYGPEDYRQDIFNDKPDCYKAQFYGYVGKESEYALLFGGPGGDCEN
ncbi:hypothetical protein Fmac_031124 [Flemingia macrophylla]|uniref:Neprosin PEP catalytic domain-containing protein n=1 Tax=Flemingia macrophylla TaxID=520843 RepID=A0ABD1L170_9FABA